MCLAGVVCFLVQPTGSTLGADTDPSEDPSLVTALSLVWREKVFNKLERVDGSFLGFELLCLQSKRECHHLVHYRHSRIKFKLGFGYLTVDLERNYLITWDTVQYNTSQYSSASVFKMHMEKQDLVVAPEEEELNLDVEKDAAGLLDSDGDGDSENVVAAPTDEDEEEKPPPCPIFIRDEKEMFIQVARCAPTQFDTCLLESEASLNEYLDNDTDTTKSGTNSPSSPAQQRQHTPRYQPHQAPAPAPDASS